MLVLSFTRRKNCLLLHKQFEFPGVGLRIVIDCVTKGPGYRFPSLQLEV
jgi:hypothetical protein